MRPADFCRRAWRESLRRDNNGEQVRGLVGLALWARPLVDFCGYWQRNAIRLHDIILIGVGSERNALALLGHLDLKASYLSYVG